MTTPLEQEKAGLQQLISALAYAQSAEAIAATMLALPDITAEGIGLLLTIPQVRGLMRLRPESGAHAATQAMYRQNLVRRAAYLAAAGRRMSNAAKLGPEAKARALVVERRWLEQHLAADANRMAAARRVGATARQLYKQHRKDPAKGLWIAGLLGWYAVMDEATSAECRKANGRNFDPTQIPPIGFPGTVHPNCRCKPGPPFPSSDGGAKGYYRVEDILPDPAEAIRRGRHAVRRVILGA